MILNKIVFEVYKVKPYNPEKLPLDNIDYNIYCGIKIFKSKLDLSRGDLDKALFYYVGRDKSYSSKVYKNISSYIFFRSEFNNIGDL